MNPLEWIKTNLIIILLIALAATFVFGSLGTLWYKNKAEKADLRAQVAEASLATCATVNKGFADSVSRQNDAVKALEKVAADNKAAAAAIALAAAKAAQPAKDLAAAIHDFKPPPNTATDPCAAEHAVVEKFFKERGGVR